MERNQFVLVVKNDIVDYLQRLGFDIDSRIAVIDRMFTTHKDDPDTSVFDSIPFKHYTKELEETQAEYSMAKDRFTEILLPMVQEHLGTDEVMFDWKIVNFKDAEVIITVNDEV